METLLCFLVKWSIWRHFELISPVIFRLSPVLSFYNNVNALNIIKIKVKIIKNGGNSAIASVGQSARMEGGAAIRGNTIIYPLICRSRCK